MSIVILFKTKSGEISELLLINKTVVGRSSKADYIVDDTKMSGRHCSLEITKEGKVLFQDLDSTNGSYIENAKVMNHLIRIADEIKIGNTTIKIDEKRLSPIERIAIGKNVNAIKTNKEKDITLPLLSPQEKKASLKAVIKKSEEKEYSGPGKSRMIEQEESSGQTKMLKLNHVEKKKK